jgi:predicted GNAT family N-acyltransferase/predicted nucleotidyltransferase
MTRVAIRACRGAAPAEARELRRRVFVEEQGVAAAEEWDAHDDAGAETLHFVARAGGRALGCARLRRADDGAAKIERVAVLREARKGGIGRALMDAAETAAWRRGDPRLRLHAQIAVIPFYERLGWRALGPEFDEADIPHRRMEKADAAPPAGAGRRRLPDAGLRALADELAALPGVTAVVLGGSHARGLAHAGSDVDLGLLYRDEKPIDVAAVRALAARWNDAAEPVVSALHEWGPWVNGGAWLSVRGRRVDLLYRSIERVEQEIAAAHAGRHEVHFGQQPPFGFWSGTLLGESACALALHDPAGDAARLRAETAAYPVALRAAVLRDMARAVPFHLDSFAAKFAARGDAWGTAACLARCIWQLGLALFAANHAYLVNDKTLLDEIDGFADAPRSFSERARDVLANPGATPAALGAAVEAVAALNRETWSVSERA